MLSEARPMETQLEHSELQQPVTVEVRRQHGLSTLPLELQLMILRYVDEPSVLANCARSCTALYEYSSQRLWAGNKTDEKWRTPSVQFLADLAANAPERARRCLRQVHTLSLWLEDSVKYFVIYGLPKHLQYGTPASQAKSLRVQMAKQAVRTLAMSRVLREVQALDVDISLHLNPDTEDYESTGEALVYHLLRPNLLRLRLPIAAFSNTFLDVLALNCPKLEQLAAENVVPGPGKGFTGPTLSDFMRNMKDLRDIRFPPKLERSVPDMDSVYPWLLAVPHLEVLRHGLWDLSHRGIELRDLDLATSSRAGDALAFVRDMSLRHLNPNLTMRIVAAPRCLQSLQLIFAGDQYKVDERIMAKLAKCTSLLKLHLVFQAPTDMSLNGLAMVTRNCTQLRFLDLYISYQSPVIIVSEHEMRDLAASLSNLVGVNIFAHLRLRHETDDMDISYRMNEDAWRKHGLPQAYKAALEICSTVLLPSLRFFRCESSCVDPILAHICFALKSIFEKRPQGRDPRLVVSDILEEEFEQRKRYVTPK